MVFADLSLYQIQVPAFSAFDYFAPLSKFPSLSMAAFYTNRLKNAYTAARLSCSVKLVFVNLCV